MRNVLAVIALALVPCCIEQQNRVVVHTGVLDDETKPDVGEDIETVHVPTTGYTQQRPGFFAVHDLDSWLHVWKDPRPDAKPPPPPRTIDFRKEMLFVATATSDNALGIEITKVINTDSGLKIYLTEKVGGPNCPTRSNTPHPMDIIVMRTTTFDIHVHHDLMRAEECGPPPLAVAVCRVSGVGEAGSTKLVASAGQQIDCDSTQSKAATGSIVDRVWQLSQGAPGSLAKLTVGTQSLGVTFLLDAWGTYQLGLEVRDEARTAATTATIEAPPPEGALPIELHWTNVDRAADDLVLPNVELHVVERPAADDCSAATTKTWCDLKVDGSVQHAVVHPDATKTYTVHVTYLDARTRGNPVACVRTFPKGKPSVAVCDELERKPSALWELGTIDEETGAFYDPRKGKPKPLVPSGDAGIEAGTPIGDGGHSASP